MVESSILVPPANHTNEATQHRRVSVVELQIPAVQTQEIAVSLKTPQYSKRFSFFKSCWNRICAVPTTDQLRWPIQVGCAAGLSSLLLTFIPTFEIFFGVPGVIGTAITVVSLEGTAGGSLRRGYLMAIFGCVFAFLSFGLFALSVRISGGLGTPLVPYAIVTSAAVLVVPMIYVRYMRPNWQVGTNFGLSSSETVLLAAFAGSQDHEPWSMAWKRALASVVGPLCSALCSQFVMRKAARPTAAASLAKILTSIGDVLERLAETLGSEASTYAFSQQHSSFYMFHSRHANQSHLDIPNPKLLSLEVSAAQRHCARRTEVDVDEQYCSSLMDRIKKCQDLLAGQKSLIDSATQEISFKRPHRFPEKAYTAIVNEIRNLFSHLASLVLAMNLYVTSALNNFPIQSTPYRSKSAPSRFIRRICSDAELQSPPLNLTLSELGLTENEMTTKDGQMIGKVARHLAGKLVNNLTGALYLIADCLKRRGMIDEPVRIQISLATNAIDELNSRREQQRSCYSEIISDTLKADVTRKWIKPSNGKQLDWISAIGIPASTFLKLKESDKLLYWDAYWLERDRISNSSVTLTTLKDSLINLCTLVDDYMLLGPIDPNTHIIQLVLL